MNSLVSNKARSHCSLYPKEASIRQTAATNPPALIPIQNSKQIRHTSLHMLDFHHPWKQEKLHACAELFTHERMSESHDHLITLTSNFCRTEDIFFFPLGFPGLAAEPPGHGRVPAPSTNWKGKTTNKQTKKKEKRKNQNQNPLSQNQHPWPEGKTSQRRMLLAALSFLHQPPGKLDLLMSHYFGTNLSAHHTKTHGGRMEKSTTTRKATRKEQDIYSSRKMTGPCPGGGFSSHQLLDQMTSKRIKQPDLLPMPLQLVPHQL